RKPWYSCEDSWTYYIYYNSYHGAGLNGGVAVDELAMVEVDKDTIETFTQIAAIKAEQSKGYDVLIVKDINKEDDENNIICRINADDEIPFDLWNT
ncbi:MAG: hypothetical protein K2H85_08190, partial [Allobaculum sp.]|nr:hypothetical protein [Allobaculum sp.]